MTNFHVTQAALAALSLIVFYCGMLFAMEWATDGENRLERLQTSPWVLRGAVYGYLLLMMLVFYGRESYAFIYFQF
jgi:ABC-type molybdate transport system permease subunit